MVQRCECAWITKSGFCLWYKDKCCRNASGACTARVRRVTEHCHRRNVAYMNSLRIEIKTSHDCFVRNTLNASQHAVYSTCSRKRRYADLYSARQAAHDLKIRKGRELFAYECPFCGGYHLTRQKRRSLLAMNGVYEESGREVDTNVLEVLVAG